MAIGTNEAKPTSDSISTQNSIINLFLATSNVDKSQAQITAIVVVLFVYSILSNVEIRLRKSNPTWHTITETCRFLAGVVASILVASIWVPVILWIGLVIWVALFAMEACFLYVEFHEQLHNAISRIRGTDTEAHARTQDVGRMEQEEAVGNHGQVVQLARPMNLDSPVGHGRFRP